MGTLHTPGPWTAKHVGGSNFAVQEFEIRGSLSAGKCVYPIFNQRRGEVLGSTVFVSPQDARLIAAAPDLLAALKALFHEHDQTYDGEGMSIELFKAWEMTRAAIAKAEGH